MAVISREEFLERGKRIKLIVLDVDGVLTEGSVILDDNGDEEKLFYVRDGFAIKSWQKAGGEIAVITGRQAPGVARRCRSLGIESIHQGSAEKVPAFQKVLKAFGRKFDEVCAIGDDVPELPLVTASGLGVAVADSDPVLLEHADWVTKNRGGRGAVREVIDLLLQARGDWATHLAPYQKQIRALDACE